MSKPLIHRSGNFKCIIETGQVLPFRFEFSAGDAYLSMKQRVEHYQAIGYFVPLDGKGDMDWIEATQSELGPRENSATLTITHPDLPNIRITVQDVTQRAVQISGPWTDTPMYINHYGMDFEGMTQAFIRQMQILGMAHVSTKNERDRKTIQFNSSYAGAMHFTLWYLENGVHHGTGKQ